MKPITVEDVIKITKGTLAYGTLDLVCENYCKDTRQIQPGDVYIGIKGENFDGNTLYNQALEKGASVCILEKNQIQEEIKQNDPNKAIILVQDSIKALQQIAAYKREQYKIPVIAITGSVGKTSTKDMVASVVGQKYQVLKTAGNYNNQIGLPLTILGLKEHTALVVEMGMSQLGEIATLSKIAKPTIAVITNVGTAHIGNLGSRENILKAKLEILEGLQKDGILVINNDNDLLHQWGLENRQDNIVTFGIENQSDVMAKNISQQEYTSKVTMQIDQEIVQMHIPVAGIPFVYNALCASTVGRLLKIDTKQILKGIEKFELTKNRMEILHNAKGVTIISDCYNASYDSMKAGLENLANMQGTRKIAVLGDMLELGEFSRQLHEKVGEEVANNSIDYLITVGEEAKAIAQKAKEKGVRQDCIKVMKNSKEAIDLIKEQMKQGDIILIKASRGMELNKVVEAIK